jgi:hypothetical protein
MSQFRGKSKLFKSGFIYRVFKGATLTLSAGAGGSGGTGGNSYDINGGGGAGGVIVSGYTVSSPAGNGQRSASGGTISFGGTGFGAGGGGPSYRGTTVHDGRGANGFAYLYINNSTSGVGGIELFYQSNITYTFTTSANVKFLLMGGGGGSIIDGYTSISDSGYYQGGHAGYLATYSVNVESGWTATITVGMGGLKGAGGNTTSIIINNVTYSALGADPVYPWGNTGSSRGGYGGVKQGDAARFSEAEQGKSGGVGGQGTTVFSQAISYISTNTYRYFADTPTIFSTWTEDFIGTTTDMTTINTATGGIVPTDGSWNNYSVEWFGHFKAPATGTYTFYTKSSDASYVWVGDSALSGYNTTNYVVNNSGIHVATEKSGTKSLTAGTFYPIRCQFGGNISSDSFSFSFSASGIERVYNMSGYVYSGLGNTSNFPAESARIIKALSPSINKDGIYYINVNGTSTATYCLMDNKWDGGGWMMLMKATRGNTFNFDSTYWTDINTTLNTGNTNRDDGDAKFNIMNHGKVKDVLALWPDATNTAATPVKQTGGSIAQTDSWSWMVPNYYSSGTRATVITGFAESTSRDSPSYSDPITFPGFSNAIWSTQLQSRRHIFGGGSHLAVPSYNSVNSRFRWGFIYNENALDIDFTSSDVGSGIGMKIPYMPDGTMNYSAGDAVTCCHSNLGLNRSMRVELYGR